LFGSLDDELKVGISYWMFGSKEEDIVKPVA